MRGHPWVDSECQRHERAEHEDGPFTQGLWDMRVGKADGLWCTDQAVAGRIAMGVTGERMHAACLEAQPVLRRPMAFHLASSPEAESDVSLKTMSQAH